MNTRIFPAIVAVAALLAPLALLGGACAVDRASTPPDLLEQYDALEHQESDAKLDVANQELALQAALETPDPQDDRAAAQNLADANKNLQSVEDRFAAFETKVNERRAAPLNLLYPGLASLATALIPLVGPRGRKLYASAIRSATRGKLLTTAGEILKAMGAYHSEPRPPQTTVTVKSTGIDGAVTGSMQVTETTPPTAPVTG